MRRPAAVVIDCGALIRSPSLWGLRAALIGFLLAQSVPATIDATLQMQLGNPSGAITDTNNHDHFLIQRTVEAIDYSDNLGEPNWTAWDLTAPDIGTNDRSPVFFTDTNLPANFHRVNPGDYTGSDYDRGHMCPSADRTDTRADNDLVFFMSNIIPQAPDNNQGIWGNFESYCRSLVQSSNNYELLIICGPSGFNSAKINTNGYVSIPQYVWKIVVVVPPGAGSATNRITTTNRVIALKVPNTNGVSTTWEDFITSANQIQVDTGYTFFTALPPAVAAALRSKVDGQTNPPPIIYGFSPTNGSAGATVTITGTNFLQASQVAFGGVGTTFNVDTITQITATVPTNAATGFVSVTTASGTAISTNTFTVINNGGTTVYSGVIVGWDMSTLTGGANNFGPSPFAATTNAPHVIAGGLVRGTGVATSGTAAVGAWGGTTFTNATAALAVASNRFATFTLSVTNGYTLSIASVSHFDYRRSSTGPDSGVLQYQVGSGAFVDITNLSYPSSASSGGSIAPIDLSGIAALQNVPANTNLTFRIVNYNGTSSSGTWYIYNAAGSTALDLTVQGTITQSTSSTNAAATFSSLQFTNNQFQFTVNGTTGSNYVVEVTTNLSPANWVPVITNAAPFVFIQSNTPSSAPQFYRVRNWP